MSLLKSVGKFAQKAGKAVGDVATKAAPVVGMIPGVGTIAGGAIGGLGSVLAGHNLSSDLRYGLTGAASGYGGAALRGMGTGAKVLTGLGAITSGRAPNIPQVPTPTPTPTYPKTSGDFNPYLVGMGGGVGPAPAMGSSPQSNDPLAALRAQYPSLFAATAGSLTSGSAGQQATQPSHWYDPIMKVLGKPGALEAGATVVGGVLQGRSDAAKLAAQQAQFNRTQGLTEQGQAIDASRSLATAPLRDRAIAALGNRFSVPSAAFRPHDIYNESYGSGAAQLGGIDQDALAKKNATYQPGQGGVNTSIYQNFIRKYGVPA